MNVFAKAASSGRSYAALTVVSQGLSWAFTFFVIRLLHPADYGLMTMAAFLTAYLQMFSGLGLGAAIVQREQVSDGELQSVFWFSMAVGVFMGFVAVALAHPTAWLFDEPRVVPVTQLIGALFVISAIATVPTNLLTREFQLRTIGLINVVAVVVSSSVSVAMAIHGYGVFTLIWANIILNACKALLLFFASSWRPRFHYSHAELRPYLKYGIYVALSGAAARLFQSMDKLVIGKLFGAQQLGLYGNAMTIASMPVDKISPLFQQVTFPLFARLQGDAQASYRSYLEIGRHYLLSVAPIYMGAIAIAPDLIEVVLGTRWAPMTFLFQVFCLVKLLEVLTSYQSVLLNAVGRHRNVFWFNLALVIVIPLALLAAAQHSFAAVAIPWLSVYPVACVGWLFWTLRGSKLSVRAYLRAIFDGTKGALCMFVLVMLARALLLEVPAIGQLARLLLLVAAGALSFGTFLWLFQRDLVGQALRTMFPRGAATG
jgi:O-antigen/teichoic acid export membrane protein